MESKAIDRDDPTHSMSVMNLILGIVVSEKYMVILDTLSRGAAKIVVPIPMPVGMPTRLPNMKRPTWKNNSNNSIHTNRRPKPDYFEHETMPGLNLAHCFEMEGSKQTIESGASEEYRMRTYPKGGWNNK